MLPAAGVAVNVFLRTPRSLSSPQPAPMSPLTSCTLPRPILLYPGPLADLAEGLPTVGSGVFVSPHLDMSEDEDDMPGPDDYRLVELHNLFQGPQRDHGSAESPTKGWPSFCVPLRLVVALYRP